MKTKGKLAIIVLLITTAPAMANGGTFEVDKNQSLVKWNGKKVTGEHFGKIEFKGGSLKVEGGAISGGNLEINMNTITCDDITDAGTNQKLVGHLKSDDFFSVATHPTSKLELVSAKKLSGNQYEYTGNLTIKGITHPVTFTATTVVDGKTLKADGKMVINRARYDVRFGSGSFFQGLGDRLIYDDFTLDFNLVASEK